MTSADLFMLALTVMMISLLYNANMTWEYIAGFFDGEGWISLWIRGKRTDFSIGCCQTAAQDIALREMLKFLKKQGVYSKIYQARPNGPRRQPVSKLYVQGNRPNKMLFLENLIPHLVIKKQRAIDLLKYLQSSPIRNTWSNPEEQFRRCSMAAEDYLAGMTLKAAMAKHQIAETTFRRFCKKHKIPRRSRSESITTSWIARKGTAEA